MGVLGRSVFHYSSRAKRLPPKTVNEKKFLSTQSLTFVLTKNLSDYSMIL